jgi:formylglycine-generating enzyme required for sulfatase activity
MHGNVWEWVEDCWNESYAGAPSDGTAWLSGNCGLRVLRGGSWYGDPWYLRSALRGRITSDIRSYIIGFRVARTLD